MGYGISIFFLAIGAVLTWAVNATVEGIEIQTVGVILMAVGALGFLFTLVFWSSLMERRGAGAMVGRSTGTVVSRDADTVIERDVLL